MREERRGRSQGLLLRCETQERPSEPPLLLTHICRSKGTKEQDCQANGQPVRSMSDLVGQERTLLDLASHIGLQVSKASGNSHAQVTGEKVIHRKPCRKYLFSSSISRMAISKTPPPMPATDNLPNMDHQWCKCCWWPCATSQPVLRQPHSWSHKAQEWPDALPSCFTEHPAKLFAWIKSKCHSDSQ